MSTFKAMDEFAKEIAIGFAEYIARNKYRYLLSLIKWTSPKEDLLTTEQLYTLFLQTLNTGN